MNDMYPHLLEMTCIEDTRRVYFLNLGVSFNELSDEEKELAYNSQQYLTEKYCEKLKEKLSENQWAQSKHKLPNESNKYVIGFSEDEYDVEIVRYERGLKKWISKDGNCTTLRIGSRCRPFLTLMKIGRKMNEINQQKNIRLVGRV